MPPPPAAGREIVAVAGARGFIGSVLAMHLESLGHRVLRIGRAGGSPPPDVAWDLESGQLDRSRLEGVALVYNLTGENIGQRWTARTRRQIVESRVRSTHLLARGCAELELRPRALLNMSAVGIYGSRGDEVVDDSSSPGTGFLADVVRAWEAAADPARAAGIRVVHPRTGVLLHPDGSVLQRLLPIFRLGAGGRIADGRQWMAWISRTDAIRALTWLGLESGLEGAVNVSSPNPVRNIDFTRALARVLGRPAIAVVPAFAVKVMYGEMGEETVLTSQRVVPRRLLDAGFAFEHADLEDALRFELASAGEQ
jgi:uncharacterized protein (TIGR01777 family)